MGHSVKPWLAGGGNLILVMPVAFTVHIDIPSSAEWRWGADSSTGEERHRSDLSPICNLGSKTSASYKLGQFFCKFGPLPAELNFYLCNGTLSKADTSLNWTVALVPRVSTLERVDCSSNWLFDIAFFTLQSSHMTCPWIKSNLSQRPTCPLVRYGDI